MLFEITLGNGSEDINELYYRGNATLNREQCSLDILRGETVSFNTFFNLYPYYEYYHYCDIDRPVLYLDVTGKYTVSIYHKTHLGFTTLIASLQIQGKSAIEIQIPDTTRGGYMYFTITAEDDVCTFNGGYWGAEKKDADTREARAEKPARIGIIICTFQREQFLIPNLEQIARAVWKNPVWADRIHVFIVDNAQSLDLAGCDLPEELYTVYPNRNLGGSGGFARGMYELSRHEEYTHMLIMDDDIQFDFATIARTYYLVCALSYDHQDAAIGGAMLKQSAPYMQHEFGGVFNGLVFRSINPLLDMRQEENLLMNQSAETPDYNAWWYCCMPTSFIKKYGLPMPYFIKSDDVEYGLRTYKELILMNGIAVWHQDFSNKYNSVLDYYSTRNIMITAIIHGKGNRIKAALKYAYTMFKGLALKNYSGVELIYRSFLDFKKGPDFLMTKDPVAHHRTIAQKAPAQTDKETLEKETGVENLHYERTENKHKVLSRIGILLDVFAPAFMLSDKKTAVTDSGNPSARDCALKKTVIHFDPVTEKGFIRKFDTRQRTRLRRATWRVFFQMIFFYGKYKKMYHEYTKLCSEGHWKELFFAEGIAPEPDTAPTTSSTPAAQDAMAVQGAETGKITAKATASADADEHDFDSWDDSVDNTEADTSAYGTDLLKPANTMADEFSMVPDTPDEPQIYEE